MPGPDGKIDDSHPQEGRQIPGHTIGVDGTGTKAVADAVYTDDGTTMAQIGLSRAPRVPCAAVGAPPTVVIAKNDDTERANTRGVPGVLDK